nr:type I-E CRISPR-associated protein Cse1/CasA [Streptomyces mexicanus]
MRTRTPTGRLDLLTWPNRRIRLHATEDGSVDAVAHHDGDRLPGGWLTTKQLDPMTAWSTTKAGGPAPLEFLDLHGWPQPWRGAFLLSDAPQHSAVVQHAIAAAERGTLAPNSTLRAVLSTAVHANQHRATLSAIPIATTPLGTAGELADPQARDGLATMARYAAAIARNLRLQTVKVSGRPSAQVAPRVQLDNLDDAWTDAVHTHAQDPAQARAQWQAAIEAAAERRIEEFPLSPMQRGQLLSLYRENPEPKEKPTRRRPPAKPARARTAQRGPAAATYEVFDGTYTLSQLSKHPDCVVSYPTLRARVDSGWDVTEAATTPSGRGPRRSR